MELDASPRAVLSAVSGLTTGRDCRLSSGKDYKFAMVAAKG